MITYSADPALSGIRAGKTTTFNDFCILIQINVKGIKITATRGILTHMHSCTMTSRKKQLRQQNVGKLLRKPHIAMHTLRNGILQNANCKKIALLF